uniref:Uncharacterized protein n=1 Tax=Lepeophtheirus salmonis TaxID=72036 RepID=A0A0K2UCH1_LEPSM
MFLCRTTKSLHSYLLFLIKTLSMKIIKWIWPWTTRGPGYIIAY